MHFATIYGITGLALLGFLTGGAFLINPQLSHQLTTPIDKLCQEYTNGYQEGFETCMSAGEPAVIFLKTAFVVVPIFCTFLIGYGVYSDRKATINANGGMS